MRKLQWVAVAALLVAGAVVLPSGTAQARTVPAPFQDATARARAAHRPVTVDALTTPTSLTTALPDGSYQTTSNAQPVRVRKNGAWTPVSATLTANGDGTFSPAATPGALRLSGGGPGPLVTLTDPAGRQLSWSVPFALPAPTVHGATATYTGVLPGVDLEVTATEQGGFSDVLVIGNARAAADPALAALRLTTGGSGLTVSADQAGDLAATATDGTVAFQAPPPRIWDSASTARGAGADAVGAASSIAGPGRGAHVATMAVTVHSGVVTLTPPATALSGPGLVYPLYLDPAFNPASSGTNGYVETKKACADQKTYNVAQPNGEGIGYNNPIWGGGCNDVYRSFFNIDTSNLNSTMVVSKATLLTQEQYGADEGCNNTHPVYLYWTAGIDANTTWNSPTSGGPSVLQSLGSASPKSAWCSAQDVNFDVTGAMQTTSHNNYRTFTFGLRGDESTSSTNYGFMRFRNNPSITTVFDITPNVPANPTATVNGQGPVNPSTQGCGAGPYGWIGATSGARVNLSAVLVTNVQDETAHALYTVWDNNGANTPVGSNVLPNIPAGPEVKSGNPSPITVSGLIDGHQYGFRVYDADGILTSNPSTDCHFNVDLSPPHIDTTATTVVTSGYVAQQWAIKLAAVDPAPKSSCPVGTCPASGIQAITWNLLGCNQHGAVTAASGTVSITPCHWGIDQLVVQAQDKAGNLSSAYTMNLNASANPAVTATPGDLTGDGAPDLAGVGSRGDLTITTDPTQPVTSTFVDAPGSEAPNGVSWTGTVLAHRGSANGQNTDTLFALQGGALRDYYNGGGPAFDLGDSTLLARPACVSDPTACAAYANPAGGSTDWSNVTSMVAVSDPNRGNKPDLLTVETDGTSHDLWLYQVQTASRLASTLSSPVRLSAGNWNNLSLIAPAPAGTLWARDTSTGAVYGLGAVTSATTDSVTAPSSTTAPLGTLAPATYPRVVSDGAVDGTGNPLLYATAADGTLDQFTSSGGVLSTTPAALSGSDWAHPTPAAAAWPLTDGTGAASIVDTTGSGRPGTPVNITWPTNPDLYRGQEVASFNGTSSLVKSGTNLINTTHAFTVAAWANLTNTNASADVASEDGNQNSGFYLQYDHVCNCWAFGMFAADSAGAAIIRASSATPPQVGVWTHLAGVFDPATHVLSLYVNGTLAGTATDTTPWDSTGVFVVGRGKDGGAFNAYFPGSISDVQLYGNALGAQRIGTMYANNFTRSTALG